MSTVSATDGVWQITDVSTQLTEFGMVEIGILYSDTIHIMTIGLKDPMLLTNNWTPAVEILQAQWQTYRQRPEYYGGRLLGVLISGDICRLYVKPLIERGPPMLFKYQGRSQFVPFPKEDDLEAFNAFIDCFHKPGAPRS